MAEEDAPSDHVEMTVQRMAELHAQQLDAQSPLRRRVSRLTLTLSRPRAVVIAVGLALVWMLLSVLIPKFGHKAFDPPPFQWLELIATVVALLTTMMILATQARVALSDQIGELRGAEAVVILLGERPGLSSPDSLGIYATYAPRPGRTDAERNCISNVRLEGLSYATAAAKLRQLLAASRLAGGSGIGIKDHSEGNAIPHLAS